MSVDDPYLSLTNAQRLEVLNEVAQQRNLHPTILEKDYWVCKTLDVLFTLPEFSDQLIFKGGTSLS